MKIYMAGPLFTTGERDQNKAIADGLVSAGHEVWLPQDMANDTGEGGPSRALFDKCIEGIMWCDVVVACMDGPDPDSGTCFECGVAFENGKAIIAYRTDIRDAFDGFGPFNLMLTESSDSIVNCKWMTVEEIASKLSAVINELVFT